MQSREPHAQCSWPMPPLVAAVAVVRPYALCLGCTGRWIVEHENEQAHIVVTEQASLLAVC